MMGAYPVVSPGQIFVIFYLRENSSKGKIFEV